MASYGEEGVTRLIQILQTEVKNNTTNLKLRCSVVSNRLYDGVYEGLSFPSLMQLKF